MKLVSTIYIKLLEKSFNSIDFKIVEINKHDP